MKLKYIRSIPGIQIHYAEPDYCIASRGLTIVHSEDGGINWREFCRLPTAPLRALLHMWPLYRRLVRGGIHIIQPFDQTSRDRWVAIAGDSLFLLKESGQRVQPLWELPHGRRLLTRSACIVDGALFIADYWANPTRSNVYIYRIGLMEAANSGGTGQAERFYGFPSGSARHVHVIQHDPYSGKLWVSTGDQDAECRVIQLDPSTGETTLVGEGEQQWRTISFAFRADAVYWGTDNHLGRNYLLRYDRNTKQIEQLGTVVGPVYYHANLKDAIVFGTSAEKGEGEQDGFGRIYGVPVTPKNTLEANRWDVHELLALPKDRWHPTYFGYGTIDIAQVERATETAPAGEDTLTNRFWITPKGFRGDLYCWLVEVEGLTLEK
ncbi:hypothetical protein KFU94_03190 [Chloroflexi bacterium TSY]|nr:hypothetical protein [Chloroflexi bacterium TSY]